MSDQPNPAACRKRPERSDQMRREAATKLVERLLKSRMIEPDQVEESIDDIVQVTRWDPEDGYKIARDLDQRHYWDCDLALAEELDQFSGILGAIYEAAEKRWADENPNEPRFSEGDTVTWRGQPAVVRGVYERRPQCYKVRQGEMKGDSFYVVPFEDVGALEEAPPTLV